MVHLSALHNIVIDIDLEVTVDLRLVRPLHQPLKHGAGIAQTERHGRIAVGPEWRDEGCLFLVLPSERHLMIAEGWFAKHGSAAVLFARFVPLLRTLIAFPAGVAKMKIGRFLAFSAVGIVIWDIILIYLGVLAGQNYSSIVNSLNGTLPLIGYAFLGGLVLVLLLFARTSRRKENPDSGNPAG